MRTKKIITLVLVLALALSAVSFGASANFSDVEENNANRAYYDLLAGLGIIKGYDDGTFKEANPVTREEAVAFIYRMANGNDNAMKGSTMFPDVAGDRWSSGYVNWAVGKGIVAGYPDGTFKPTNTVTVAEMAKMMVVALGWPTNNYTFPYGFINKAQDLKVLDNVNAGNVDQPCTRAMVSVITYNTLFADRMEYNIVNGFPVAVEGVKSFIESGRFNAMKSEGFIVNGTSKMNAVEGMTKAGQVNLVKGADSSIIASYALGNAEDMIGREVTVWYKNSDDSKTLKNSSTIIALVPNTDEKIATVNMADISDVADSKGKIKIDGVKYDISAATTGDKYAAITGDVKNYVAGNTNTVLRVVYKEENKEVSRVYTYTSAVKKVSRIASNGDVTFANVGTDLTKVSAADSKLNVTAKKANLTAYEDIAKDDIVYVAVTSGVVDKAKATTYIATKADVVSGVAYNAEKSGKYTFGSTDYKMAYDLTNDRELGNSYDLVLSPTGFISAITGATTTTNKVYGLVTNYGSTKTGSMGDGKYTDLTLTVMGADGVEKTYPVSNKADKTPGHEYIAENDGGWVMYNKEDTVGTSGLNYGNYAKVAYQPVELSLNAEGTVTKLVVADGKDAIEKSAYSYTKKTGQLVSDRDGSYVINADTGVFTVKWDKAESPFSVNNSAKVSVVKGSALGDLDKNGSKTPSIAAKISTGDTIKTLKAIVFADKVVSSGENNKGYIEYVSKSINGSKTYYNYKATINGEVVSLSTTEEDAIGSGKNDFKPYYGEIQYNGEELVSFTAATITKENVAVKALSGNVLSVGDSIYTLSSDVKVYKLTMNYTEADDTVTFTTVKSIWTPGENGSMPTLDDVIGGESTISFQTNDDGLVVAIYLLSK